MIDVGDLVGLIFAIFFALAMLGLTYVFFRLSRTVDQLTKTVEELTSQTTPLRAVLMPHPVAVRVRFPTPLFIVSRARRREGFCRRQR